jgi:argininosuccinate lyase
MGPDAFGYDPKVEDLFFLVEAKLIELAGPDAGGDLQIARSRNDLAAAMCRLFVRQRLTETSRLVLRLRERLLVLIERHRDALMPGITHTQPAQPTTLGHYLLGVLGPLERDSARLHDAWRRVNQSPLGAAAFTTTSFPIDRRLTADLLGFDGAIENGYDAVGAADHLLESTQALVTMVASLSRFVGDLLIWSRLEVGILHVGEEFIQISSIMPQKRNPVVLEHIRTRIGYVDGDASTVAFMIHGAAFGDTNDVEDPIYVPIAHAFNAAEMVLNLLNDVLETAEFNTALLAERANQGNMTTTALADGLVRDFGLPFRTAHRVTAQAVQRRSVTPETVSELASAETSRAIEISADWLSQQLDPRGFVAARAIAGGPAPSAMAAAIARAQARLDEDRRVVDAESERAEAAARERGSRIDHWIGTASEALASS